ncbi:MAG: hypothetical protein GYB31_10650 [Bacteroidetes bacterium]|nr:hypothetical protein [Bacteroidota bacterium]
MQKSIKLLSILVLAVLLIPACYYDVEEELYPTNNCDLESVTYTDVILPILEENCFVCHNAAAPQGGVQLEGYSSLKIYVDSGQLLGAIKHESGFSPMPQGQPQLDECTISKFQTWIDEGAMNN